MRVEACAIGPARERGRRVRKAAEPRAKPRLGLVGARVGALARELRVCAREVERQRGRQAERQRASK